MKKKLFLLLTLALLATAASGQDVSKQNERKRQIEEEISFINNQLKSIAGKQKATTEQLSLIRKRAQSRQALINDLDRRIAVINDEMTAKQREINRLQKELDTLEIYYNKLIYNTYKNRDTRVWYMYLLASESIGQGYRRFSYLRNLSDEVGKQAAKMREKQAELQEKEYTATVGGGVVTAVVTGKKQVKSVEIDPEAVDPDDVEMLQDLVVAAVNEALRKCEEDVAASMNRFTGGMNLGGLGGLL